ncbi:cytochrome P450 1A1-like [Ylistrum balloti]|uniref:cytochrome P450 1A1-like n=1 Tax=Ylistrum balloti TaxID=509963 RepID=UPI002905ADB3|nr:cytochrome P450 1A1-like [Ylistrum balloti]
MDIVTILVLIATIFLCVKFLHRRVHDQKLPPGPWGFPIIGHLPLFGTHPPNTFAKWRQKYGDIFRIRIGTNDTVVVSGRDTIKEVLGGDTCEVFSDRPAFFTTKLIGGDRGLTFSYYTPRYVHHRTVATSVLKTFTDSRNTTVPDVVENEASILVKEFLEHNGEPFDPRESLFVATGSIIYQICYGMGTNGREDTDLMELVRENKAFNEFVRAGSPFDAMPFLRYILPGKFQKFLRLVSNSDLFRDRKIAEHKETFQESDLRDATDCLISAAGRLSEEEKSRVGLLDHVILESVGEFVGAGFDTTASVLSWAFMYIAEHQDIQTKIQQEMDAVIGIRSVRPQDRSKLPYTEAAILETIRISAIVPFGIPHATKCDVKIHGYFIPKGTAVFFNLYSVNFEEEIWQNPHNFDPERFLTDDGKLNQKLTANIMSFGYGKRRCIGEILARMELFLLFTNVLQKCSLEKPVGETYDKEGVFHLVRKPHPYRVRVLQRCCI